MIHPIVALFIGALALTAAALNLYWGHLIGIVWFFPAALWIANAGAGIERRWSNR